MERKFGGVALGNLAAWVAAAACAALFARAAFAVDCSGQPDGTPCSDGLFCNGPESCLAGTCTSGPRPCTAEQICSEGEGLCVSLSSPCPPAPQSSCRTSVKALLLIKTKTDAPHNKLMWNFIKGDATSQVDLQDPRFTADYALCLYAGTTTAMYAGTTEALVAQMNVPPDHSKWSALAAGGFRYFDSAATENGIQRVVVQGGPQFHSKVLVKGGGVNLPDPLNSHPLGLPVVMQLINYETGVCFTSTFANPDPPPLRNNGVLFKAIARP